MSNTELMILTISVIFLIAWIRSSAPKKPIQPKTIRVISDKNGKILQMQVLDLDPEELKKKHDSIEEKMKVKFTERFKKIVSAFASGDVDHLKKWLSPKVFSVFLNNIKERQEKNQKMEFSFISDPEMKILTPVTPDMKSITVEFISEQVNILKNAAGKVIEGDAMIVTKIQDIWTFEKQNKDWILLKTQGKELNA